MKKLITLFTVLFLISAVNQAQTLEKLFSKYGDDERFEYVSLGKGMFNMANGFGGIAKNEKEFVSKMRGLKILTLKADPNSAIMKSFTSELDQVLKSGNFETAMEVRDKGERVNIFYRVYDNDNADMLIITKNKGELNMIWISGKMTKEEMMKSFSQRGGAKAGNYAGTAIPHETNVM